MQKIIDYCEKNPVTIYADYRDEIPENLVTLLLEKGRQAFEESAWEYEISMQDSWYEYGFCNYVQECADSLDIELTDESDDIRDLIQENLVFDFSDFWKTAARNTRVKIALIPVNPETDGYFDAVHWENDFSENLNRARALTKYFGIRNYRKIESCYSHESLKIMGKVDLWEFMQHENVPEYWDISPQDKGIFHTSWNGSGCLGDVTITKKCRIKCNAVIDTASKYGIDAVYGFVGSVWSSELSPVWGE